MNDKAGKSHFISVPQITLWDIKDINSLGLQFPVPWGHVSTVTTVCVDVFPMQLGGVVLARWSKRLIILVITPHYNFHRISIGWFKTASNKFVKNKWILINLLFYSKVELSTFLEFFYPGNLDNLNLKPAFKNIHYKINIKDSCQNIVTINIALMHVYWNIPYSVLVFKSILEVSIASV